MKIKIIISGAVVALVLSLFFLRSLDDPEKISMGDSLKKSAPQESTRREELKIESVASGRVRSSNTERRYDRTPFSIDLTTEKIVKIKEALALRPIPFRKPQKNIVPIKTVTEAFDFLLKKYSMAFIPLMYDEDEEFFYFSGGVFPEPVNDFSTGLVVNKSNRSIVGWDIR